MLTAQQRGSFPLPTISQGSETSFFAAVAGINPDYLRLEAQNTPTVCVARSGPPSLSSRIKTSNCQGQATTAGLATPPAPRWRRQHVLQVCSLEPSTTSECKPSAKLVAVRARWGRQSGVSCDPRVGGRLRSSRPGFGGGRR